METEIIRSKNDSGKFIITDKRITKIANDGTILDIPADMISAVKKTSNSIVVYSAISELEMEFIGNVEAVYKALLDIIIGRQELKSSIDKLTALLSNGAPVASETKAEVAEEAVVAPVVEEQPVAKSAPEVIEDITDDESILDDIAAEEAKSPFKAAPVANETKSPFAPKANAAAEDAKAAEPVQAPERKRVVNPNPTFNQKPSVRAAKEEIAEEEEKEVPSFKKHVVNPNPKFGKAANNASDSDKAEDKEDTKPGLKFDSGDAPSGGGLMKPNQASANSFRRPMQTPANPPMGFMRNVQQVEGAEEDDNGIRRRSLGLGASEDEPMEENKLRSADREESSNANRQTSPFASASANTPEYSPFAPANKTKSKLNPDDSDDNGRPKPIWAR